MKASRTRLTVGWLAATRFAGLVTAIGAAVSAIVVVAFLAVAGMPGYNPVDLPVCGAWTALVATVLHIPVLALVPPQSRWGVFWRAIAVSAVAVAVVALGIGVTGVPWVAFQVPLLALGLFAVTGAFLVPGTVAALCAPLLDPRLRAWRRGSAASPTGHPAPPP